MIPSIFVSSTIADLHYLRDGIRDAIVDLAYRPVMSEHAEVGYINPTTAAESCYRSVKQCQMVVLILGRRYGTIDADGISVTHREYRAAQEHGLPTITFAEPQVLSFHELYESNDDPAFWDSFDSMDTPRLTFSLLEEIRSSTSYNAVVPFSSVGDAKKKLKLQIADFVGDRLFETVAPATQQVKDVLAEVITLRNMISHRHPDEDADRTKRYLTAARFLLSDAAVEYRDLLEYLYSDMDHAITELVTCASFAEVVTAAGWSFDIVPKLDYSVAQQLAKQRSKGPAARFTVFTAQGGYIIYDNNTITIAPGALQIFEQLHRTLQKKITMP